jgi:hypothetical protein
VKSVGSPYTVYFGRNLHGTFMYAYSQVGVDVRHKLEVMLATWRAPVPGSLTTTPVFPLSSTQKIVDDLSKLRNNSAPQPRYQQHPNQGPARSTPTPTYGALPGQTFQPTLPIPLQQVSTMWTRLHSLLMMSSNLFKAQPLTSGSSSLQHNINVRKRCIMTRKKPKYRPTKFTTHPHSHIEAPYLPLTLSCTTWT